MGKDDFPEELTAADIYPLLMALDDPVSTVRAAAARGLVRLPLDREALETVGLRMEEKLLWATETAQVELIDAAAFLPLRRVRRCLWRITCATAEETRDAAWIALAKSGDPDALSMFLAVEARPPEAWPDELLELLPQIAKSEDTAELGRRFAELGELLTVAGPPSPRAAAVARLNDRRWWIALALARSGDDRALRTVIDEARANPDAFGALREEPALLAQKLARVGPLPEQTREWLLRAVEDKAVDGPLALVAEVLITGQAPEPAPAPTEEILWEAPAERGALLSRVTRAVGAEGPEPAGEKDASDLAAELLHDYGMAVQERGLEPESVNELVSLIREKGWRLRADSPELLPAYRLMRGITCGASQIGWLVSREGLRPVIAELVEKLAATDAEDRVTAAELVEAAARSFKLPSPPLVGSTEVHDLPEPQAIGESDWPRRWMGDIGGTDDGAALSREVGAPPEAPDPASRFLNAGFFPPDGDTPIPKDEPLDLRVGSYRLGVNVGEFWGPGERGDSIEQILDFGGETELDLDVVARSFTVAIEPERRTLRLARRGDSELVFFDLTLRESGLQSIGIHLLYRGHLLQARRLVFFVVGVTDHRVPGPSRPVQDGYVTFSRTDQLDSSSVEALAARPRRLTIVAAAEMSNRIGLHLYDSSDVKLSIHSSEVTEVNLGTLLEGARGQLAKTMTAYAGGLGGSEDVLRKHLAQLADIGHSLYTSLFPAAGTPAEGSAAGVPRLAPGSVIQVAALSSQLSVPWEIVYERRVESYREHRARLCGSFRTHGPEPEECPGYDDPRTVCPHGFWGYRYIIEQIPGRLDPHAPLPRRPLAWTVANERPLRFDAAVYNGFNLLRAHWASLEKLERDGRLKVQRLDTLEKLQTALAAKVSDILYFYSHGGQDELGRPYLEIGDGDQVKKNDLEAWQVELGPQHPLVLMNACESADYSPERFENIIKLFCDRGAAGVIGTQCEVREHLANRFVLRFLEPFLNQVPAGQALFDTRLELLHENLDPRGLVYSLFASAEVALAQAV